MHHPSEQRQTQRDEMLHMTESLIAEYAGLVPAGSVIAYVARCRENLLRSGVRQGLVPATEAAVRVRISATLPARSVA